MIKHVILNFTNSKTINIDQAGASFTLTFLNSDCFLRSRIALNQNFHCEIQFFINRVSLLISNRE